MNEVTINKIKRFKPKEETTLKKAVELWCNNKEKAQKKYGHISEWDVSLIQFMQNMFYEKENFNDDLSKWDTSNVENMSGMFYRANLFNYPINDWDVSNVNNMTSMFHDAKSFNQQLNKWDVSNVQFMDNMFDGACSFNKSIQNWKIPNVISLSEMFKNTKDFNQPLNKLDVSNVINMNEMFTDAESFNQDLNSWKISINCNIENMLLQTNLFEKKNANWYNFDKNNVFELCKNMNCERFPLDWDFTKDTHETYEEDEWKSCAICDGYFNDDGLGDILFIEEEPNNRNASCDLCGKIKNIVQMKGTGQYICQNACDESDEESDDN